MSQEVTAATQAPALWAGALEEARSLIGVDLRRQDFYWNREAGPDDVRHFSWGIGDENPLFCDTEYGKTTRWKSGLAPGCYLYTIDNTVVAPKLRGIQWIYTGTDWEFYGPIRHRDRFTTRVRLVSAEEKQGRHASNFIIQTGECLYYNEQGTLVARALGGTARIARAKAEGGLKYESRKPYAYTGEELREIDKAILAEKVRGNEPRYWEDVKEGDGLQPVIKGPLNVTDVLCWYCGGGQTYKAHGRNTSHLKRHPADAYVDPETGAQGHPARGHMEEYMAREVGMPGGYDVGLQRISWLGQLMTNWMGDDGFLRRLNCSVRRPNIMGDTTWCHGKIVDKRMDDGQHVVDVEVWGQNQLGETTTKGLATAVLPSKSQS